MDIASRTRETRQGSMGWLIQRAASRFEAAMAAALADQGLTIAQFALLMRVLEHDDQTQTELGACFAMPAWAISRALDGLESAGLVTRRRCPFSRRSQRIRATPAALGRAPALHALVAEVNARVLDPLDPAQRAQLHDLLTALVQPD